MSLTEGIWSDCDMVSALFWEVGDTTIICIQGFQGLSIWKNNDYINIVRRYY